MENDDGFIQVPYKHALQRKKQTYDHNPVNVSVRACEAEKEKYYPEMLIIFTTVSVCLPLYRSPGVERGH